MKIKTTMGFQPGKEKEPGMHLVRVEGWLDGQTGDPQVVSVQAVSQYLVDYSRLPNLLAWNREREVLRVLRALEAMTEDPKLIAPIPTELRPGGLVPRG